MGRSPKANKGRYFTYVSVTLSVGCATLRYVVVRPCFHQFQGVSVASEQPLVRELLPRTMVGGGPEFAGHQNVHTLGAHMHTTVTH